MGLLRAACLLHVRYPKPGSSPPLLFACCCRHGAPIKGLQAGSLLVAHGSSLQGTMFAHLFTYGCVWLQARRSQ
jgi:hypothetical protein